MHKLTNKIAIGCLVQFYEIEIIHDYLLSVKNALDKIENKRNVIIDVCFNLNQGLEQVDETKTCVGDLRNEFRDVCLRVFGYDYHYGDTTEYDFRLTEHDTNGGIAHIYTIADYRREFNEKYCEKVDVLMWGESDSLIPRQTFEILDNLHTAAKETTPKYVGFFATCKMWDDTWKVLEHPDFTDKPFTEGDLTNWWSLRYNMSQIEMDKINDKVEDLDIQVTQDLKFNGCGLVISSDVVKSGVNIPKSVFFVHEDTAFMNNCLIHFQGQLTQYIIKNVLLVHNRKLPNKRMYIKGQDFETDDMTVMRKKQFWFPNADKMSQQNAFNLNKQAYTYTWDDVFRDYEK
jgi:hypothetical protein|tara:strand:- start:724 stop:1758 length:1035 start_codon:yes stop_codon:yes gene_type:complete